MYHNIKDVSLFTYLLYLLSFQSFVGNTDRNSIVYHQFLKPVTAVYVRLHPRLWHSWMSMRAELYGCTGE